MGFFNPSKASATSESAASLAPAPFPIGVKPQYISQQEIVLKLREKKLSLSGDSFDIKMAQSGQPVFKCSGSVMSLHSKKYFTDAQGNPLVTVSKRLFKWPHTVFDVLDTSTESVLFTVRSSWVLSGTKMLITFNNAADGKPVELQIRGDFFDRNAKITIGKDGPVVARIDRSFLNVGQLFTDTQTYYLKVAPGVDGLMMAAICVCLDEKANDK